MVQINIQNHLLQISDQTLLRFKAEVISVHRKLQFVTFFSATVRNTYMTDEGNVGH